MRKAESRLMVEFGLPLTGMECLAVRCYDASGKLLDQTVSRIEIEPLFSRSAAIPTVLYGRVLVKTGGGSSRDLCRQLICVAGATGELRLKNLLDVGPKCLRAEEDTSSTDTDSETDASQEAERV